MPITIDTGMNTKPVMQGVSQMQSAIRSLNSSVVRIGKDLDGAFVGYAKAMENNVNASRNFNESVNVIQSTLRGLELQLNEIAKTKIDTKEYAGLKKEIQSAEKAVERLNNAQQKLKELGKDVVPTKEYRSVTGAVARVQERLSGLNKDYEASNQRMGEIMRKVGVYRERFEKEKENYISMLSKADFAGRTGNQSEESYYKDLADKSRSKIVKIKARLKGEEESLAAESKINDGLLRQVEKYENAQDVLLEKKQAIEDSGNTTQMSEPMRRYQYEVQQATDRLKELEAQKAKMESDGTATINGRDTEQYRQVMEKYRMAQEDLAKTKEKGAQMFSTPQYLKDWERMPTLSDSVAESFARMSNAANIAFMGMAHPIQALDRAIPALVAGMGTLAQKAWNVAVSFGKMAARTVVNTLKSLATTAYNTAAGLAKIAASTVVSFFRKLAESARSAAAQLAKVGGNAVRAGLKGIGSLAAMAGKSLLGLGKSAKRSNVGLKSALKLLIRYGLGVRSTYMLVRKLRQALIAAFNNMAKKVPEVNKVLSSLASSLDRMKNSMATAFQPILTAISPILVKFMDLISEALTKVGMFFAAITGQNYVYKATKANINYADSLDKTKKSAQEAENQLAKFDDLNILEDKSKDSNDNSTPTSDFEKVPIDSAIKDFVQSLKDALTNSGFGELGRTLATQLNKAVAAIDMNKITTKVSKVLNNLVTLYNGFMEAVDWTAIGEKLAEGVNGLLDKVNWEELGKAFSQKINALWGILSGLVNETEWDKLGKKLAELAWGYFGSIKWNLIGKTIGKGISGIAKSLKTFSRNFPWKDLGEKLASGANKLFDNVDWNLIAEALTGAIDGAFTALLTFIQNFDWEEHGTKLAEGIESFIKNLPAEKLGEVLREGIIGILDFILPAISNKETWKAAGEKFAKMLNQLFKGDGEGGSIWSKLETFITKSIEGILVAIKRFNLTFEWDENANQFHDSIMKLADHFPADELGSTLAELLTNAIRFMSTVLFDPELWKLVGQRISQFFNRITGDKALWAEIGTAFNNACISALTLGEEFINGFKEKDAATSILTALGKIQWGEIATQTWTLVKQAFAKAGSFVDALFSEPIDYTRAEIDGAYIAKAMDFNSKPLGERMALKIKEVFGYIPWKQIATDLWGAAKVAFREAGNFIATLLDADSSEPEAIGEAVGKKLADIPWASVFETLKETIMGFLNPMLKQLLNSKDGRIFIAVSGLLLSLRLGLGKIIVSTVSALSGVLLSSLGLLVADIILVKHDIEGILDIIQQSSDLIEQNSQKAKNVIETYNRILQEDGEEAANTFAYLSYGIQTEGKTAKEVLAELYTAVTKENRDTQPWFVNLASDAKEGLQNLVDTIKGKTPEVDQASQLMEDAMSSRFEDTDTVISAYENAKAIADASADGYVEEANSRKPNIIDAIAGWFSEGPKAEEIATSVKTALGPAFEEVASYCTTEATYSGQGFFEGLRTAMLDENGTIKSDELRSKLSEILSPAEIEAFERGEMTVEQFFLALGTSGIDEQDNATDSLMALVNEVLGKPVEAAEQAGTDTASKLASTFILETLAKQPDEEKAVESAFNEIWGNLDAEGNGEMIALGYFGAFNKKVLDESGRVKPEFKDAVESMFGSVEALENGEVDAQDFLKGLIKGMNDSSGETSTTLIGIVDSILEAIRTSPDALDEHSPSKKSAEWAKLFLEGFAQGAEDNQEATKNRVFTVFKTISDAISGVVSGVKNFFSKILGGGKKDADTGVSADDIAKPYEDGAKRAETALDGLKKNTATALGDIKASVQELEKAFTDALNAVLELGNKNLPELQRVFENTLKAINDKSTKTFSDVKTYLAKILPEIKSLISTALNDIKKDSSDKLSDIYRNVVSNTGKIKSDVSIKLKDTKDKAVALADEMKTGVTKHFDDLYTNFTNDADSIQTKSETAFVSAKSYVDSFSDSSSFAQETFASLATTAVDGVNDIESAASDFSSINTTMYNALSDTYTSLSNYDFSGIGSGIISGIITGINNGWEWLRNTVQALAQAAYKAAKAALGINSPSRVFRDGVGKQMIAGMEVGMEQAEPNMLKTIGNIAQNAADEMAGSQITANVGVVSSDIVDGIDDVLTRFSDKVTNSFTSLVDKLNAIAETVAFREPNVAAGNVLPYNVSANSTGDHRSNSDSERASQEDLISSMIQLVNNQTSALVQAIQQYGGTTVNLDARSLTDAIVDEINRRTRTNGRSPLIS